LSGVLPSPLLQPAIPSAAAATHVTIATLKIIRIL
jgi:hypothetical protein